MEEPKKILYIGPKVILSAAMAEAYDKALKETTPEIVYPYTITPRFEELTTPIKKTGQQLRRERRAKSRKK